MANIEIIQRVEDVRGFAAKLNEELDRCNNGEGTVCVSLDASLEYYAARCCRLYDQIRAWARDVFCGRVAFDESMEEAWVKAGVSLKNRSVEMLKHAHQSEDGCWELSSLLQLEDAVAKLSGLLDGWIRPTLSVGPGARHWKLGNDQLEAIRGKVAQLPGPNDWPAEDARHNSLDRKASNM
jgi:hypothetical protein